MQITGLGPYWPNLERLRIRSPSPVGGVLQDFSASRHGDGLQRLLSGALKLQDRLEQLAQTLGEVRTGRTGHATAASTEPLSLDLSETATSLVSTEEVNTTPTSFTPFGPDWSGGSTSVATLGGIYGGVIDEVYSAVVQKGGEVGGNKALQLKIYDSGGRLSDTVNIPKRTPPDTPIALSSGLELSLSAGKLDKNDTFSFSVFASIGSAVDPDKPFDGVRNDNPNLEPGQAVTAGAFQVNGETITVSAADTIHTVLDRITASDAGVIATFDSATETVRLTHETLGSAGQIVLGPDSSGFLAATKLAGAAAVPGKDSDLNVPLATLPAFSQVQAGTFAINGVELSVDPAVDTLGMVLERIRTSDADVSATLDPRFPAVRLRARHESDDLVLDDGTSGMLSALELRVGTHEAPRGRGSTALSSEQTSALQGLGGDFAALFRALPSEGLDDELLVMRDLVRNAARGSFRVKLGHSVGAEPQTLRAFGLELRFDEAGGATFRLDEEAFEAAFREDPEQLVRFLVDDDSGRSRDGLIPALREAVGQIEERIVSRAGARGLLLDVIA